MSRKLIVKEVILGRAASYYTMQELGQETDLVHQFFEREGETSCTKAQQKNCSRYYRCRNKCFRLQYLADLYSYLYEVGPRRGFRFDDKPALAHAKLYYYPVGVVKAGPFRVYGLFLGDRNRPLFVATGGGYKQTRTIQDDSDLNEEYEFSKNCLQAIRRARIGVEETKLNSLRLPRDVENIVLEIN